MLDDKSLYHWGRLVHLFHSCGVSPYTWNGKRSELVLSKRNKILHHFLAISNCVFYTSFYIYRLSFARHKHGKIDILEMLWTFNFMGLYTWGLITSVNNAFNSWDVVKFYKGLRNFDRKLSGK